MGVTGCGKTTVGTALAERLSVPFYDGDDFHPAENVAKMKSGEPLDDDDRAPWLARLSELMRDASDGAVLACSALKEDYRRRLSADGGDLTFVHLEISPAEARRRLEARRDHYMPASLVESQFATLEKPTNAIVCDGERRIEEIVASVLDRLAESSP